MSVVSAVEAVAVVLIRRSERVPLSARLEAVRGQSVPPAETVIVEVGELLRPAAPPPDLRIPVLRVPAGHAAAWNLGVTSTASPLVLLLDDDALPAPGYLARAAELLAERSELDFVSCALSLTTGPELRERSPAVTVADAVAGDRWPHSATVFRRCLFDRLDGFDPRLAAFADADFWLRALAGGASGIVLDEELIARPAPLRASVGAAVLDGGYLPAKRQMIATHVLPEGARGEDAFATLTVRDTGLLEQNAELAARSVGIEAELAVVEAEIELARVGLERAGIPAFDWGGRDDLDLGAEMSGAATLRALTARAVRALVPDPRPARSAVVQAGGTLSAVGGLELIVLERALEVSADPAAELRRARAALRPGGRLVVIAATVAVDEHCRHAFTARSLSALVEGAFDQGSVTVSSYGNLMTTLEAMAPSPGSEPLTAADLDRHDPSHPTLLGAVVEAPSERRYRTAFRGRRGPHADPATPAAGQRSAPSAPTIGAVLAYQRVGDAGADIAGGCTPPDVLARQLEFVAEHHRVLPLAELVSAAVADELTPGAVAITFDGGYAGHLDLASPILGELRLPATFFVSGSPEAEPREAWWDTLECILLGSPLPGARLQISLGGQGLDVPVRNRAQRVAAWRTLHGYCQRAMPAAIQRLLDSLVDWTGSVLPVRDSHRRLTAAEITRLATQAGHEIGTHGADHLLLPVHPPDVQAADLAAARATLEQLTGTAVTSLAYPFGAAGQPTTDVAAELGFKVACTAEPRPVDTDCDPLRVPRLDAGGQDLARFRRRLDEALVRRS